MLIKCLSCDEVYTSISSSEWYTSGSLNWRQGYCPKCYNGGYNSNWEWTGSAILFNCKRCDHTYNICSWYDWKHYGSMYMGHCTECYDKKKKKEEYETRLA